MKSAVRVSVITFFILIIAADPILLRSAEAGFSTIFSRSRQRLPQSGLTYIVDRLTDVNPAGGGDGTGLAGDLRYSIINARSGDSITFSVTGTINLSGSLPPLTQDITIQGVKGLIVLGNSSNVLSVDNNADIVLSDLIITGGIGNGGGILNKGKLTLNHVTISHNRAGDPTNGGGTGAGIWNYVTGILILNNSTISDNTVLGNSSYNPSRGGGIANYGILTLNNSTVSGNSALEGSGGGISNTLPTSILTLNNSTISDNSATGAIGNGSGIDNLGTLNLNNTIIAGNLDDDLQGVLFSYGHNLIGNETGGSGYRSDLGDLLNINPLLRPLEDNGGLTQTHALSVGSPAIDTGDNTTCLSGDQRGIFRPQDGDQNGTATCDIGAYEFGDVQPKVTPTPVPVDMLTATLSLTPPFTDTPIINATVDAATPTSTPVPPPLPCSGAAILALTVLFILWSRLQ